MPAKAKPKRAPLPAWGVGAQVALAVAAVAAAGAAFAVPAPAGLAVGVVGGLCVVLADAAHHAAPTRVAARLIEWLAIGVWLALAWGLAIHADPGTATLIMLGVLVAGCQIGAHLNPYLAARAPTPGAALVLGSTARAGTEWQDRIKRVARMNVEITDVRDWETRTGYTITLQLPTGGATRKQLAQHADGLAADARLPEGCGVEVLPGPNRGAAVLHVSTINRLAECADYPADYGPRSIMSQIQLGEYRNSGVAGPHLRQNSALLIGTTGSGKTTLLNVLTAGAARCTDALVWHIDLTGGGLSLNWLIPWLRGASDRPALDWAVNTAEDALAMAKTAVAISKVRKLSGHDRKIAANTTLLPIGPDLPEIVIIVDEGKTILAPRIQDPKLKRLREELNTVLDIARDSAVRPVFSALGSTAANLDPDIKRQCSFRVGMPVESDAELAYLLDWGKATMDDLAGTGSGFVREDGSSPRPARFFNLLPDRIIGELAPEVSRRRPELDEASVRAAGEAYARRHERMRSAFTEDPAGLGTEPEQGDGEDRVPVPAAGGGAPSGGWGVTASWDDPTRRRGPVAAIEAAPEPAPPPVVGHVPPILTAAIAVFDAEGEAALHRPLLAQRLTGGDEDELRTRLKRAGVSPAPKPLRVRGEQARGFTRADVAAAIRRFETGDWEVD